MEVENHKILFSVLSKLGSKNRKYVIPAWGLAGHKIIEGTVLTDYMFQSAKCGGMEACQIPFQKLQVQQEEEKAILFSFKAIFL